MTVAMASMMACTGNAHAQVPNAFEWPNTDFSKTLVDLDEILSGGPPKDGIPSIDKPHFVTAQTAAGWLDPREPVIVISIGNDVRAYPVQILMWHEIVNDTISKVPISVTFCPLCNATIVFDRRLDGKVLDFGTTGRLRKSDLVMYDRQTESWWQQFSGRAIVGELAGKQLARMPASIVAFEDFRKSHPQGEVLTFTVRKGQIIDIQSGSQWSILDHAVDGPLAGRRLRATPGGVHFAFAWLAFNPDSTIWQDPER